MLLKRSHRAERPLPAAASELPSHERRAEPRHSASGPVRLRQVSSPMAEHFEGRLLDTAASGFRVRHKRLSLASGEVVHFEFGSRSGCARVVWTRIVNQGAETGFHILSQPQR